MSTEQTQNSQRHYKYFVVRDIKKFKDSSGNEVLSVPIQSLQADREGDVVNEQGQQDIIRQLQTGKVPAFPNHGMGDSFVMYDFREIMGKWVGGEVKGNTTYGYLQLRKNNASAEALMDLIEQDMPVGFSIGFIPKEYEEKEIGMEFSAVDLLEVSPVGIPSNAVAVHGNNVDMINAVTQAIETDGSAEAVKAKIKQFIGGNMTEEKQSNEQAEQETKDTQEGSELENKVAEDTQEEQPEQSEKSEPEPDNQETKESDEEKPCPDDDDEEDYKQFKSEVKEKLSTLESKIQKIEESLKDKSKSVETKSEESETEEAEDTYNNNDMEEQGKEEYENGNEELDTATEDTEEPKDADDTAETTEEESTEETGETEEAGKSTEPENGKGKKIKTIDETNTQEEQSIQPEEPKVRGFRFRY